MACRSPADDNKYKRREWNLLQDATETQRASSVFLLFPAYPAGGVTMYKGAFPEESEPIPAFR
jgi:hypothetical protein